VVIVFQHCHIVNKRIGFFCFSSASVRSPPVGISLSNHPASCFEMPCRVSWKFFLNKKICQCFTQGSALGVGLSWSELSPRWSWGELILGMPPSKGVTLRVRTLPLLASKSLPILRRRCNIHPLFHRDIHVRCRPIILGNFYKCFTTVYLRPHFNLETGNCLFWSQEVQDA